MCLRLCTKSVSTARRTVCCTTLSIRQADKSCCTAPGAAAGRDLTRDRALTADCGSPWYPHQHRVRRSAHVAASNESVNTAHTANSSAWSLTDSRQSVASWSARSAAQQLAAQLSGLSAWHCRAASITIWNDSQSKMKGRASYRVACAEHTLRMPLEEKGWPVRCRACFAVQSPANWLH